MFVKICGITSEEDALFATAMGADALGFVFAPSPRQVTVQLTRDIVRRLPPEVLTVGVFRNEAPARVVDIIGRAGLHAAQLHGSETPEQVAQVRPMAKVLFKALAAGSPAMDRIAEFRVDAVLVDGIEPGSGELFDWRLVDGVGRGRKLILAGGLDADNVADAIAAVQPWGVDVSTGVERSPGVKDPLKVRAFIQAARAATVDDGDEVEAVPGGERTGGVFDWREV